MQRKSHRGLLKHEKCLNQESRKKPDENRKKEKKICKYYTLQENVG